MCVCERESEREWKTFMASYQRIDPKKCHIDSFGVYDYPRGLLRIASTSSFPIRVF